MPRLLREKPAAPTALQEMLAARGAYARCTASHTSRAGFTERGATRPLPHDAVDAAPEYFDVVLAASRLREPE